MSETRLCAPSRRQADASAVRQIPEEEQLYRGVSAPQRKAVSEQAEVTEMPKVRAAVPRCFCCQGARSRRFSPAMVSSRRMSCFCQRKTASHGGMTSPFDGATAG